LGALPSGATFTEKQGHGWNPTNVAEYFQVSSSDEDNREIQKEQKMILSKQFEAHHLMLWTMRCIKVTSCNFIFNVKQKTINMVIVVFKNDIQQCLRRIHSVYFD
jgi:hypothetical protein